MNKESIPTLREWGDSIYEEKRRKLFANPMMGVACNAILEDMVWEDKPTLWQRIKGKIFPNRMKNFAEIIRHKKD